MKYIIYPCDLTAYGECPFCCQDCQNCVGYTQRQADEAEYYAEHWEEDDE